MTLGADRIRSLLADPDLVLATGHSRPPGSAADADSGDAQPERLTVVLAVNSATGRIAAADSTLATDLAAQCFRALVEGLSVVDDLPKVVHTVQTHYAGPTGAALTHAMRRCVLTFHEHRDSIRYAQRPND